MKAQGNWLAYSSFDCRDYLLRRGGTGCVSDDHSAAEADGATSPDAVLFYCDVDSVGGDGRAYWQ